MSMFRTSNNPTTNDQPARADERTVTGARNQYAINRAAEQTAADGPTERLNWPAAARKRDSVSSFAVLLAVLALVLSGGAAATAWRALTVARAAPPPVQPSAPGASADIGFTVAYAQEPLRVQVGCSAVLFLDLDEPRANADEHVSDLRYDSSCGKQAPRLTLGPGAGGGAQIADSDTDAAGCDRAIRTSPLGPGASLLVRRGVVLCVLTAAHPAQMVLVQVTDVDDAGMAGLRATSWKVAG